MRIKSRNIEKCEVRIYNIDLQAYFRKMHGIGGVEALDVSLIQPNKTLTYKPDGYRKYQPMEQEFEIPFSGQDAGACVVTVSDDDWESTVLVLRSDLEMMVKSSRREVLTFCAKYANWKTVANVDLLVSDGSGLAATGKTGNDGVSKRVSIRSKISPTSEYLHCNLATRLHSILILQDYNYPLVLPRKDTCTRIVLPIFLAKRCRCAVYYAM